MNHTVKIRQLSSNISDFNVFECRNFAEEKRLNTNFLFAAEGKTESQLQHHFIKKRSSVPEMINWKIEGQ